MFHPTSYPWSDRRNTRRAPANSRRLAEGIPGVLWLDVRGARAQQLTPATSRAATPGDGSGRRSSGSSCRSAPAAWRAVLRTAEPTIGDLVLDLVSLDYQHTLMAAAGDAAEAACRTRWRPTRASTCSSSPDRYRSPTAGSTPRSAAAPRKDVLEDAAKGAAAIIAVGACAHWGSVQAARPNPTGAVGVRDVIKDKPVVNIAGCPPIADVVTATVVHYLTFGRLPGAGLRGPPAVRLRRADPRPVPRARQLRRRAVRGGLRRRGGTQGLVPVQGRLQGTGDVLALSDLPVEHADQLADRRGPSVHRLHRAASSGTR